MLPQKLRWLGDASGLDSLSSASKEAAKGIRSVATAQAELAQTITKWGKREAEDLQCISDGLSTLNGKVGDLYTRLAGMLSFVMLGAGKRKSTDDMDACRALLKHVQQKEDSVASLKRKQRDLQAKLEGVVKPSATSRILGASANSSPAVADSLRADLNAVDREVMAAVADLEGFKRESFRHSEKRKWNATVEFCVQLLIVANFGNHLADQIPQGKLAPGYDLPAFKNEQIVAKIMSDYEIQADEWLRLVPKDWNYSENLSEIVEYGGPTGGQPLNSVTVSGKREHKDDIYIASLASDGQEVPFEAAAVQHIRQNSLVAPNAFKTATLPATISETEEDIVSALPVDSETVNSQAPATKTSVVAQPVKGKRASSLALAVAESAGDEKKGVGVMSGSVGDGVTDMLKEIVVEVLGTAPQPQDNTDLQPPTQHGSQTKSVLGTFVVMFDYTKTPSKADEISIAVGDLVVASNVYEDGWGYGIVKISGSTGFFPFNAVFPVLDATGLPYEQETPATVAGVAVSPSPHILHQEGIISSDDYDRIVAAMASVGSALKLKQ
ncbi:hypothetical protein HDU83_003689 [Entophlyctis luteolus]|nr:hypothetical protein HDU83_003689 [Entophlyctis luteolus]